MAEWQPPPIKLAENYGVKQDSLVDSCTDVLRRLLLDKCKRWMRSTGLTHTAFIKAHPYQNWYAQDYAKFSSPTFEDFDLPLCSKWLIAFRWLPHEAGLTQKEINAIRNLRDIRNAAKHQASSQSVTEPEYINSCKVVQHNLKVLGIDATTVNAVISKSDAVTLVSKPEVFSEIQTLNDKQWPFQTLRVLGSGAFGIVLQVNNEIDGSCSAVKIIPTRRTNKVTKSDLRESRNLASLDPHANIMKYTTSNYFQLSSKKFQEIIRWKSETANDCYPPATLEWLSGCLLSANLTGCYIQTEVCGENLRQWLSSNFEPDTTSHSDQNRNSICEGILSALDFIHNGQQDSAIVHRDLRPENIYFARPGFQFPVKVGDFGLSNCIEKYADVTQTVQSGQTYYRAPEISAPHPDPNRSDANMSKYGPPVDLFSAGLIFGEVFNPVEPSGLQHRYYQICFKRDTGNVVREQYPNVDEFVLSLTDEDPQDRLAGLKGPDGRYVPFKTNAQAIRIQVCRDKTFDVILAGWHQSGEKDYPDHATLMRPGGLTEPRRLKKSKNGRMRTLFPGETKVQPLSYKGMKGLIEVLRIEKLLWYDPDKILHFFKYLSEATNEKQDFRAPFTEFGILSSLCDVYHTNPESLTRNFIAEALSHIGFPDLQGKLDSLKYCK